MKTIDRSPLRPKPGQEQVDWQTTLKAILKYGWRWYQAHQAEERIIRILGRVLDNRFTVVRGVPLSDKEILPPLLIGPPGVFLLYVWPKAGFFRIREDQWEVMQRGARRYRPGKPNVVGDVLALNRRVEKLIRAKSGQEVKVTPLMVFANPAADVDTVRPKVRPVLLDGLRRYAQKLTQAEAVFDGPMLLTLTDIFRPRMLPPEGRKRKPRARKAAAPPKAVRQAERYLNFTPRQWAILGGLAMAVLLFFICAIVYVLTTV